MEKLFIDDGGGYPHLSSATGYGVGRPHPQLTKNIFRFPKKFSEKNFRMQPSIKVFRLYLHQSTDPPRIHIVRNAIQILVLGSKKSIPGYTGYIMDRRL
jgi:hypothetical protein